MDTTAVATPSRLTWMGQALVPLEPDMTSSWIGMSSSFASSLSRPDRDRAQLGPTPMTGPPPSLKVSCLDASGLSPWVTSTATHRSGAIS